MIYIFFEKIYRKESSDSKSDLASPNLNGPSGEIKEVNENESESVSNLNSKSNSPSNLSIKIPDKK